MHSGANVTNGMGDAVNDAEPSATAQRVAAERLIFERVATPLTATRPRMSAWRARSLAPCSPRSQARCRVT
jgi:hypothetical protein